MRIAAKRLRYALEIFAPLFDDKLEIPIKSSRQAQQILGEMIAMFGCWAYLNLLKKKKSGLSAISVIHVL